MGDRSDFIEKITSFLTETGNRPKKSIDFSFLGENKAFLNFFMNTSSEDYIFTDKLELANKLKKESKFFESEEKLDKILFEEYSCDVNKELPIWDCEISSTQDELLKFDDSIEVLRKLDKYCVSEINGIKTELKNVEKRLEHEKSKLNNAIDNCSNYDHKLKTVLQNFTIEYRSYEDICKENFLSRRASNGFLVLMPSEVLNSEFTVAMNKISRYIKRCHSSSLIPVPVMNTTALSCNSTLCSTSPSNSDLSKFCTELFILKESLKTKMIHKMKLEAEEDALTGCLQFLKGEISFLLDLMCGNTSLPLNEFEDDEDDQHQVELDRLKLEYSKFVDSKVRSILINLYENKIVSRQERLEVLDNFSKIAQRYCAIADFMWMIFVTESESIEVYHSNITSMINSLSDYLKKYLKCKKRIEELSHQTSVKLPSEVNLAAKCSQNMLVNWSSDADELEIAGTIEGLNGDVSFAKEQILKPFRDVLQDLNERYMHFKALKRNLFLNNNTSLHAYDVSNVVKKINSDIDKLDDVITYQTKILSEVED